MKVLDNCRGYNNNFSMNTRFFGLRIALVLFCGIFLNSVLSASEVPVVSDGVGDGVIDGVNNGADDGASEGAIRWESTSFKRDILKPQRVSPIRYEGLNTGESDIRILSVKGDCSACAQPKASVEVVKPGQSFTINAMVRLTSLDGLQRGTIAVLTEEVFPASVESSQNTPKTNAYSLTYELGFSPGVRAEPTSLSWVAPDISTKEIKLFISSEGGFEFRGVGVDSNLFRVSHVVEDGVEGFLVRVMVTPLTPPVSTSFLTLEFSSGAPPMPQRVIRVPLMGSK